MSLEFFTGARRGVCLDGFGFFYSVLHRVFPAPTVVQVLSYISPPTIFLPRSQLLELLAKK